VSLYHSCHCRRLLNPTVGQSTLPSSCPVCEHAPLSADDCKPHKNLRTTIRVFLKTEEKKRGGSHPKESEEPTPTTTPVEPKPAPVPVVADKSEAADGSQETSEDVHTVGDAAAADQPSVPEVNGAREVSIAQPQEQSDEKVCGLSYSGLCCLSLTKC